MNKYLNKLQILREEEERERNETKAKNKENNRVYTHTYMQVLMHACTQAHMKMYM